jgi:NDP-sugar pyrophosphorylase family protein
LLAIIEKTSEPAIPMLPIAGCPLLFRQLEWLRACGFDQVAVEIPIGPSGEEIAARLQLDALGWDAVVVATNGRVSAREIASRAGFPPEVPVLAIPGDVLGGGDLTQAYILASSSGALGQPADLTLELPPPAFLPERTFGASLRLINGTFGQSRTQSLAGWGMRILCPADAIAIGSAALDGRGPGCGLLVRASETFPGIWVARGGRIQAGSEVTPPVLIGPGAIVRSGARVGPRVFLGAGAVVEQRAVLSDAIVAPDTIVGEKVIAQGALVTPTGLLSAELDGMFRAIADPLILTSRKNAMGKLGQALLAVLMGLLLIVALALLDSTTGT